jgi:NADH-ubiquinone oxidoreductase chain 5
MYLLLLFLPFLSAFTIGLFGRFLGDFVNKTIACFNMFLTTFIAFFLYYEVLLNGSVCTFKLGTWLSVGDLIVEWGFLFDNLTVSMCLIISTISFLVHLYSLDYMKNDFFISLFMAYLSLFTGCMLILVTADNFLQMFLGWEGVGLCSFLLINFWTTRYKANFAGFKAMLVNRIGDFMLFLAIIVLACEFNTLDYLILNGLVEQFYLYTLSPLGLKLFGGYSLDIIFFVGILILIGAVSKSAQLGLHTWLPDAMEGPTPVSALIHAATMVTAGVFVIIRLGPLFEYSRHLLFIIMILGSLTAFFASWTAIFQNDLKRVIAYSTCSQLGYMLFSCGISNYSVGLFHLMNHAFFKALLFLSSGIVIHALLDEQDMRKMGGLVKLLPFTYLMILIGSLALMGFPFLTGFYSKDVLLELGSVNFIVSGIFCYILNVITAGCTAFYSFRLFYLTFYNKTNNNKIIMENLHEASFFMLFALLILCLGSIFFGYIAKDIYVGLGSDILIYGFGLLPSNVFILESEYLSVSVKNIPFIISIIGILISMFIMFSFKIFSYKNFFIIKKQSLFNKLLVDFYFIFSYKWLFDLLYKKSFIMYLLNKAYSIFLVFLDRGLFEIFGPLGLLRLGSLFVTKLNKLQSGLLYHYIYLLVLSLAIFLFYLIIIL